MKAHFAVSCVFAVWLLLASFSLAWAEGQQQIVNGDFETGDLTGWTVTGGNPTVTSEEAYSGQYSACLRRNQTVTSKMMQILRGYPVAQITSLTFMAKIDDESGGVFAVKFYYSDGNTYEDQEIVADNLWNEFNVTEFLEADKTLSGIEFYMAESGTLYVDDVALLAIISDGGGFQPPTSTPKPSPALTPTPSPSGGTSDFFGDVSRNFRKLTERLLGDPWLLLLLLAFIAALAYLARRR